MTQNWVIFGPKMGVPGPLPWIFTGSGVISGIRLGPGRGNHFFGRVELNVRATVIWSFGKSGLWGLSLRAKVCPLKTALRGADGREGRFCQIWPRPNLVKVYLLKIGQTQKRGLGSEF